jgi:hypothetical protein
MCRCAAKPVGTFHFLAREAYVMVRAKYATATATLRAVTCSSKSSPDGSETTRSCAVADAALYTNNDTR